MLEQAQNQLKPKITKQDLHFLLEELYPIEDSTKENLHIVIIRECVEKCLAHSNGYEVEITNFLPLGMVDFIISMLSVREMHNTQTAGRIKMKLATISAYWKEQALENKRR